MFLQFFDCSWWKRMKITHQNEVDLSTEVLGFSISVLCVANAYYGFIYCDIGPSGRFSDERVTECTKFYEKLMREKLNPPLPRKPDIIFVNSIP